MESSAHVLSLSVPLNSRIVGFAMATRGFPSGVSGNWSRMIYLSAATITTLGYGDIVPLSSRARNCISAEAILGVALAGLFLNSLARTASQGSERGGTS